MKGRLRQLLAGVLIFTMLLSSTAVFAEDEAADMPDVRINGELSVNTAEKTILYVAKDGKDSNAGTIDKPFATIEKARDTIRALKKSGELAPGGAVVYIRGGEYVITKGINFNAEDSGTEEAPIIYRNYPDEVVDFVGAASIPWDAFKPVTDEKVLERIVDKAARKNIYAADLFELGFTELPVQTWPGPYSYWSTINDYWEKMGIKKPQGVAPELIINGKAMTVARYPNDSQMEITEVVEDGGVELMKQGKAEDAELIVIGVNDNRVANWTNAKDALMTGTFRYSWGSLTTQLGSVDPKTNRLTAKYLIVHQPVVNQLFHVYNLIEEIDMPGEYYVDRDEGMLYVYPPDMEVEDVKYTMLDDTMFLIQDASYITLKGINMKYMRYRALQMNDCNNCSVIGSEVTYTGYQSFWASGYNNKFLDCWFHDVEGGAEFYAGDRATLTHGNNVMENCTFYACDRLTKNYMPAITLTACGNIARYNSISKAEHNVVSISGNEHLFEFNEVSEACQNTDDAGALYTLRNLTHRGNVIRYNYFHDIGGASRGDNGVHAIFFDDWWSAADVVGNIFADVTGAGCMAAGSHNVFSNNMFINCAESLRLTRSYNYGNPDSDKVFFDGIANAPYIYSDLWLERYPEIANVVDENGKLDMNNNIVATNNVLINSPDVATSDEVAATATVENNVTFKKDPGFYDMLNKNYLLKDDAEVFEKIPDFKPIPFTRIGTYSERAINRVDNAYVFSANSPYVMKNGERVKSDKTETIIENGVMYIPLRSGAEAIGATVDFVEETNKVTVATGAKTMEFTSGAADTITVNGNEYKLENGIINRNYTNYISVNDLVNAFDKYLTQYNGISVIADEVLFNLEADEGILRYIEEQLTMY